MSTVELLANTFYARKIKNPLTVLYPENYGELPPLGKTGKGHDNFKER